MTRLMSVGRGGQHPKILAQIAVEFHSRHRQLKMHTFKQVTLQTGSPRIFVRVQPVEFSNRQHAHGKLATPITRFYAAQSLS